MSTPRPAQPPPCLNDQQLREFVIRACERGYYGETFHSEVERAHRNISPDDILWGLQRDDWVRCAEPRFVEGSRCWRYQIRTVDIEGDELHLVIEVDSVNLRFEVVTKW